MSSQVHKADRFCGLFSTWSVQSSMVDNVDAVCLLRKVVPPLLINLNETGANLWLVLLGSIQQGRALQCSFVELKGYANFTHFETL